MQTNWKNKIEKEKELKENEEKLIAENIRKEKEEKEKLIAENFRRKKETNDKIALTKSKRLEYLKKKYGKRGKDIYDGKFWIGMSRAALIDSLGNPESINKSVSKWGIHEQFVYDNYLYIYVENNIVTSYQKSE